MNYNFRLTKTLKKPNPFYLYEKFILKYHNNLLTTVNKVTSELSSKEQPIKAIILPMSVQ